MADEQAETPTRRERILKALADLLASEAADGFFPPAPIDEPEPSRWELLSDGLRHAAAVQDGPPPQHLGYAHAEGGDELELEAAIAYAVVAEPQAGQDAAACRARRRARRDQGVKRIAALIRADPTLGLGGEVYARVQPADRREDVVFPNAPPAAVAIVPVIVLYTGDTPAD